MIHAFVAPIQAKPNLGDLGFAFLHVDPNAKPRILPCRNISVSMHGKGKQEIDKRQFSSKSYYDRSAHLLPLLCVDQNVLLSTFR